MNYSDKMQFTENSIKKKKKAADFIFEDEEDFISKNPYRKKIFEYLKKSGKWNNTFEMQRELGFNYRTIRDNCEMMASKELIDKMIMPYGKKEMAIFKAK